MRERKGPFSFRDDPAVPSWDHRRGLIVFDGTCIFCSAFTQFVVARDPKRAFVFATAQGHLGAALYEHYGLDPADFETNLVIVDGALYERLDAFCEVMSRLGWPWRGLSGLRLLPRPVKDFCYFRIAKNRYRIFGRFDRCVTPTELDGRVVG